MCRVILILLAVSLGGAPAATNRHALVDEGYAHSPLGEWDNGYPEERFDEILAIFQRVYEPLIEAKGGQLRLLVDWTDGAVNMWAWRSGSEYWLEIPGGMARYYLISEEGFIQSICHELGHLLGGSPARGEISYEGQSDYYASWKCMKLMLSETEPFKEAAPTPEAETLCEAVVHLDRGLCQRSLAGALSLTSYYAKLERADAPRFSTPSFDEVQETLVAHPPAQCRLDTMLAGTLCDSDDIHACPVGTPGARPACWYYEDF